MSSLTSQLRIAERKETNAQGFLLRARRRMKDGDLIRAIGDYSRAIERDPRLFEAYFERYELRVRLGQMERAITDFDLAIEWNPHVAEFYNYRAMLHAWQEDLPRALTDAEKAVELDSQEFTYRSNLQIIRAALELRFYHFRDLASEPRKARSSA